jgi:hypothetical protein
MLFAAIALIILGLVLMPFTSFFSVIVSIVGVVVLVVWLLGLSRREPASPS